MVYKGVRISEICYNFAAEINSTLIPQHYNLTLFISS